MNHPQLVAALLRVRRERDKHLPSGAREGAAFNMLLELASARLSHRRCSVSALCYSSFSPHTTALRHLGVLEALGLVERTEHPDDARSSLIALSPAGEAALGGYLTALADV